jgi:hypothetical protein
MAEENNKLLAKNNEDLEARLLKFKQESGLLDLSVKDLGAVEKRLESLWEKYRELQLNETKLNEEEENFLLAQHEDRLLREKRAIRLRLRDQFEDADMDRDGVLSTPKEINKMKEYCARAGIVFEGSAFDADGDGKIRRWELMETLTTLLDQHYATLIAQLKTKKAELRQQAAQQQQEIRAQSVSPRGSAADERKSASSPSPAVSPRGSVDDERISIVTAK